MPSFPTLCFLYISTVFIHFIILFIPWLHSSFENLLGIHEKYLYLPITTFCCSTFQRSVTWLIFNANKHWKHKWIVSMFLWKKTWYFCNKIQHDNWKKPPTLCFKCFPSFLCRHSIKFRLSHSQLYIRQFSILYKNSVCST